MNNYKFLVETKGFHIDGEDKDVIDMLLTAMQNNSSIERIIMQTAIEQMIISRRWRSAILHELIKKLDR